MTPSDLQQPILLSVLGAGLATAFLHAALPTHWLPFVLVGRAQRWSLAQVMSAVVTAGLAHIVTTAVVGSLIVVAGLALDRWIAGVLPWVSAGLLFAFGAFYLVRALVKRPALAGGPPMDLAEPSVSHRAAFIGLVATLAISPGEVLLPYYLSQATQGFAVLVALTVVFAIGTVAGMAAFTALARAGYSILRLERWARYEGAALGLSLILIGVLVASHHH
jgi:hypothetical protein